MARLVRNPQEILDQIRSLLPMPAVERARREPTSADRILDAALAAFSADGVRSVTMTRVARDADVSREWLYRQFKSRNGLIIAVTQREVGRFIHGLALRSSPDADFDDVMVDSFVYAVEFLRSHELLQRVLNEEPEAITGRLLTDGRPVMVRAVGAVASYLEALANLEPDAALVVADALVRLTAVITFVPDGPIDLSDAEQLRRYARTIVPAIIAGASTTTQTD